jgi:serine phosphatase RsbU (regulator of sigma subunit)
MLVFKADTWLLTDLDSRHGTFLNGIRLTQGENPPVHDGDLVRVGPWTFRIGGPGRAKVLATEDDHDSTIYRVHRVPQHELSLRAQHRLDLLIDCCASIPGATDEQQLAAAVLDSLLSGTGFPRAAFLRPSDKGGEGQVEVVAIRTPASQRSGSNLAAKPMSESQSALVEEIRRGGATPGFSRSLLKAASSGQVARLDESGGQQDYGQSVYSLGIQAAICAPVMLDSVAVAFLYLDARRPDAQRGTGSSVAAGTIQPDAAAFCQAVSRICALSLANLQRKEIDKRNEQLVRDLKAARDIQDRLSPKSAGEVGGASYLFKRLPGRLVAGDLFDLVPLSDGRLGIVLGDVCGKGMDAALLMMMAQTHVNVSLRHHGDPAQAMIDVNRHIAAHIPSGRFITMWVGVLDSAAGVLTFVDAGHGHWLVKPPGQPAARVTCDGGYVIGIDPEAVYKNEQVALPAGSRLILYSDGLVEQVGPGGDEFGLERTINALNGTEGPAADVAALLDALVVFAAPQGEGVRPTPAPEEVSLSDDVTVASLLVGAR